MNRRLASIVCMAAGDAAGIAAALLAFGVAAALAVLAVSLVLLAILLGWT